ncbi:ROK family protein, partial [Streptomyces sp. NPDC059468]|uniref:ROK family protein n=1 Tax=Streptomyces sp. NPDC059468 TaxID=3346845 RepID=UPI00369D6F05
MGLTIGVDIGGTKIAAGVVDEEGNILSTYKVPTPGTPEAIVDAIASAVEGARAGHEIVGVGIGAAGLVYPQRATGFMAPHIHWGNQTRDEKLGAPTRHPLGGENH